MGKFSQFDIRLASLAEGRHEYAYTIGRDFFTNMENSDVHDADIHVALTIVRRGELYTLHFAVSGTVTLLCDRCLDALVVPMSPTYDITVKYGDEYNDQADDILEIPRTEAKLNVAYMLYDTIVLAIPPRHVHPRGECNRAMSAILKKHRAGDPDAELEDSLMQDIDDADAAGNDPRWDALRGLADNE